MAQSINIDQIVNQIAMLDYGNKIDILAKVVRMIKTEQSSTHSESIKDIKGLGKEIWNAIDAKAYLENERGSWD